MTLRGALLALEKARAEVEVWYRKHPTALPPGVPGVPLSCRVLIGRSMTHVAQALEDIGYAAKDMGELGADE